MESWCVHCGEREVCEAVEGNPVCEECFYKYYNRDWTERTDRVEPQDLVFGNDWQQKKTL